MNEKTQRDLAQSVECCQKHRPRSALPSLIVPEPLSFASLDQRADARIAYYTLGYDRYDTITASSPFHWNNRTNSLCTPDGEEMTDTTE